VTALSSDAMEDLGFAIDAEGAIVRVFGSDHPRRVVPSSWEDLRPLEQDALDADRSPALYHWNNLVHLGSDGEVSIVYARGKDFVPFSALEYVQQLKTRILDPNLGPATLQVQPYQTCNDDCTFCCTTQYRQLPIYKGHRLSRAEWFELIDRHADGGGTVMEIIGGGEPTLHPDFVDVLHHLHRRGVKAYLFTNGTRFATPSGELNHPLLEAIAESCVMLTVSLDGYRNRHLVHRKIPFEQTVATFAAMEHLHRIRDPKQMSFYNSFILTGGAHQASNLDDLYECVARQAGWVDSIHVQNDFVSLSHLELNAELAKDQLQRTLDDHFRDIYVYYNYPLIARFGLSVPYSLSTHNRPSSEFEFCPRGLLAPTVECGSNMVWPCGKYAGEAKPEQQEIFATMHARLDEMRRSPDKKNGIACEPCIHSSYNQSLLGIAEKLRSDPRGRFFHFYDRRIVEATMTWPMHRPVSAALEDRRPLHTLKAALFHPPREPSELAQAKVVEQ
jgi:organic radical activating enzyme